MNKMPVTLKVDTAPFVAALDELAGIAGSQPNLRKTILEWFDKESNVDIELSRENGRMAVCPGQRMKEFLKEMQLYGISG